MLGDEKNGELLGTTVGSAKVGKLIGAILGF